MARYTCPSCGERYNGRRCRNCLYEHFSEEISHGNHTHKGEPLVIDAPVRKPIRRKDPFDCDRKTRKKHPFGGFLVLLALIQAMLPLLKEWGLELEARERSYAQAEAEPIGIPEDAMVLYDQDGLTILADWENGQDYADGIPVYAQNGTGKDLTISARDIIVNSYLLEDAYFYCDVRDGTNSFDTFYLQKDMLSLAGITKVESICFHMEIREMDSYETVAHSPRITLQAGSPGSGEQNLPEGQLLYDQDGIRVSFLGYQEDEYHPEDISEGLLLFHIENGTERYLQIYTGDSATVGGEQVDLALWCELYPGTKTVSTMYLYDLKELDIENLRDLFPVELTLHFADRDDWDFIRSSGAVTLTGP